MAPDLAPPPAPFSAPRTSVNRSISPHRSFAYGDVSLERVKAVKTVHGGTVNDVVLALCAGALRRYFDKRGETVDGPLVALVPISVRADDSATGNAISSMLVSLCTDIADPLDRLHAISAGTRGAKEQHNALGAGAMQGWQELAQPALTARAARLYSRMRVADRLRPAFNLTVSNVPGPPFLLYSFGSRSVATYPMGPLNEGCGLNITVASYCGDMAFGFHACRETVDDVWQFPDSVEAELEQLS